MTGRKTTCRCPMTWGCKQPADGDDGLCGECRTDCSAGREATCPWPCDDDCPEVCHEVHLVAAKRSHEREDCPAVAGRVAS